MNEGGTPAHLRFASPPSCTPRLMRWTRTTLRDARRMPWKNGGGITLELAVEPPGASLETGFAWRLSSAEVAASGPFSAFPGLERTLLLLSGDGFQLELGSRGSICLDAPFVPVRFAGDWPARADLLGGPCVDFNLMADPTRCHARLEVWQGATPLRLQLGAATVLVYVAQGTVAVPLLEVHLGEGHLLRLDGGPEDLALLPGYGGASLIVVRVD